MSEEDELYKLQVRAVVLKSEVERDLQSRVPGPIAYVISRSRREAANALGELITVDPRAEGDIRELQNLIARHANIIKFLGELVLAGKEAENELSQQDLDEIEATLNLTEMNDQ